uniref:Uncharacterized protein n=1 Tax=Anopheles farauti TaxID=69004 RepID=A0A182QV81_9DIPT
MDAGRLVLQRGQLVAQHVQRIDRAALLQILEVLLLEQQKLHLAHARTVRAHLDHRLQLLQVVIRLVPVAGQHVGPELGRCRVLQAAARLGHQHFGTPLQPDILQVLPDQPHNVLIGTIELHGAVGGRGTRTTTTTSVAIRGQSIVVAVARTTIRVGRFDASIGEAAEEGFGAPAPLRLPLPPPPTPPLPLTLSFNIFRRRFERGLVSSCDVEEADRSRFGGGLLLLLLLLLVLLVQMSPTPTPGSTPTPPAPVVVLLLVRVLRRFGQPRPHYCVTDTNCSLVTLAVLLLVRFLLMLVVVVRLFGHGATPVHRQRIVLYDDAGGAVVVCRASGCCTLPPLRCQ